MASDAPYSQLAFSKKQLEEWISCELAKRTYDPFKGFLRGLLPRRVVSVCLIQTGISGKRIAGSITATERKRLIDCFKDFRLKGSGHRPFSQAILTAGGMHTYGIDPQRPESHLFNRLHIAVELLDVDADTAGDNPQAPG